MTRPRRRPGPAPDRTVVVTTALATALLGVAVVVASAFVSWATSPLTVDLGYALDVAAGGGASFRVDPDFAGQLTGAGLDSTDDFTAVLADTDGVRQVAQAWPLGVLVAALVVTVLAGVLALLVLVRGERVRLLAAAAAVAGLAAVLVVLAVVRVHAVADVPQADLGLTLELGAGAYLGLFGVALVVLGCSGALVAGVRAVRRGAQRGGRR